MKWRESKEIAFTHFSLSLSLFRSVHETPKVGIAFLPFCSFLFLRPIWPGKSGVSFFQQQQEEEKEEEDEEKSHEEKH